jgi:hypothetical protein
MRRTIVLLTTMALILLVASGVALAVNMIGTNGRDILEGTNGHDNLVGRGGNDDLFSQAGNDNLLGGPRKDRLVGGKKVGTAYHTRGGEKTLLSGPGNDMIIGGRGADTIIGGEGNDLLATGDTLTETADDEVFGGDGTDVINALSDPAAKAMIFCGAGTDVIIVNRRDVVAADCEKVFVGQGSRRSRRASSKVCLRSLSSKNKYQLWRYRNEGVSAWDCLRPLFTRVRGIGILGSSVQPRSYEAGFLM